jgi:hypothetical protein
MLIQIHKEKSSTLDQKKENPLSNTQIKIFNTILTCFLSPLEKNIKERARRKGRC